MPVSSACTFMISGNPSAASIARRILCASVQADLQLPRSGPINFPLLTRRPFRMPLWLGFAASAARRSSTLLGIQGAVADSTSGIRRFKRGPAGGRIWRSL